MGAVQAHCCDRCDKGEHQVERQFLGKNRQVYTAAGAEKMAVPQDPLSPRPSTASPFTDDDQSFAHAILDSCASGICELEDDAHEHNLMKELGRLPKSPGLPLPLDDDRCIEMLVHIEKAVQQQDTGLRVLHGGVGIFVVTEVIPGGLVEETNFRNKRAGVNCVQVNDQIIVVNGVSGNDALMTHEFKRSRCLTLGIRRYAEVSNKEGCLALELSNLVEQPEFNRGQQSPKKATAKHDHPLE